MKNTIDVGFIGCGGHAWRNIYPALQWAPVNLVATCDLDEEKAKKFARQFGALRHYTNHMKMLSHEKLDAVFIVAGYNTEGQVLHAPLAIDAMRAGMGGVDGKPAELRVFVRQS